MRTMDGGGGGAKGAGKDVDCVQVEDAPELKVKPIKEGTVIDHIPPGLAFTVLSILGITGKHDSVVSVAINVESKTTGERKDIVKIENKELMKAEIDKIALIAPKATINIIRNYKVAKKDKVKLPDTLKGLLRCPNPNCISNQKEPVSGHSVVESRDPLVVKCHYCGKKHLDIIKEIRY